MPDTSKPVLAGQTLIDIAMQELGDPERSFELAVLNEMSLTGEPQVGATLLIPAPNLDKRAIVQMFKERFLAPASADLTGGIISQDSGIDYDVIEIDLIVQ